VTIARVFQARMQHRNVWYTYSLYKITFTYLYTLFIYLLIYLLIVLLGPTQATLKTQLTD